MSRKDRRAIERQAPVAAPAAPALQIAEVAPLPAAAPGQLFHLSRSYNDAGELVNE